MSYTVLRDLIIEVHVESVNKKRQDMHKVIFLPMVWMFNKILTSANIYSFW